MEAKAEVGLEGVVGMGVGLWQPIITEMDMRLRPASRTILTRTKSAFSKMMAGGTSR